MLLPILFILQETARFCITHLYHVSSPGTRQVVSSNARVVSDTRGQVINSFQVMPVIVLQYPKLVVDNGQSAADRPVTAVHLQRLLVVGQSEVQLIQAEKTVCQGSDKDMGINSP